MSLYKTLCYSDDINMSMLRENNTHIDENYFSDASYKILFVNRGTRVCLYTFTANIYFLININFSILNNTALNFSLSIKRTKRFYPFSLDRFIWKKVSRTLLILVHVYSYDNTQQVDYIRKIICLDIIKNNALYLFG